MTESKTAIRKKYRDICSKIPVAYKEEAGHEAVQHLLKQAFFIQSERIACYLSTKHEFHSTPLIEAIWQAKKHCYVPVVTEENEKSLNFVPYHYGDALHQNRYSILEPANPAHKVPSENVDIVIVPLIAFDRHGHRLGTGGGYYDRTFAFLHAHPPKKPRMIGLGFAAQEIDLLPHDPWDIKLDGVVTEKEFILCS
jgi:5-formyltetrahydrofolate cyclo-ligase